MTARAGPSEADAAAELRIAVIAWLDALGAAGGPEATTAQRAAATFPFGSDERFVWDYRPGPRRGLAFAAMTPGSGPLPGPSSTPR